MSALVNKGGAWGYNTSVMAARREAPDSLDFFPTPPPMTRALIEDVFPRFGLNRGELGSVREPAAGQGHMAEILREYFRTTYASDVHDYGAGYPTCDYIAPLGLGLGDNAPQQRTDWIITNPPFNLATDFLERALGEADVGVALLLRTQWSESEERYERVFKLRPPQVVAQFVERIAMLKGRWDPAASTATAYAWYIWVRVALPELRPDSQRTRLMWIAPGVKRRHTRQADVRRFAKAAP